MAGNTAILKHSPNVTGCVLAIERLFGDAGLPTDVFRSIVVAEADVNDIIAALIDTEFTNIRTYLVGTGPPSSGPATE